MNLIRAQALIGSEGIDKIKKAKILLFGIGGVGGFTAEALVRSGVENLTVVDGDNVADSNFNRQIIATLENQNKPKTQAIKERVLSINKQAKVTEINTFYLPENADAIDFSKFDYVIDAVDTVTAKIEIIKRAKQLNIPIISCMGTGGKLFPEKLKVSDISKTQGCPLARVMRRELKNRNIKDVKVVYSEEQCITLDEAEKDDMGRPLPSSMIFVPATAGLLLAREVILDLIG